RRHAAPVSIEPHRREPILSRYQPRQACIGARPETTGGVAVLHRMVASADVLVENFRPSVPARLGIDYPRLRTVNPRLIYAGLTGYGDAGPLSDKGGFDQVLQCLSGMAVFQGGG